MEEVRKGLEPLIASEKGPYFEGFKGSLKYVEIYFRGLLNHLYKK